MTIQPTERLENVEASLYKYVEANYTLTPVDYAGAGIDEENTDEWVRVDVVWASGRYGRQVGGGLMGEDKNVLLNMNIFVKQTSLEQGGIYRTRRIRDTIHNLFRVPLGIAVNDWDNGGGTRIGTLQTYEFSDQNLGLQQELALYQYNITSTMRYLAAWSPP